MKLFLPALSLVLLAGCSSSRQPSAPVEAPPVWAPAVTQELGALGFGNWIIVADASFPVHSGRGVRTVVVDGEIPEVLRFVVDNYDNSENVKPTFNTARELPHVENDRAPGIDHYRKQLKVVLQGHEVREMDHRSLSLLAQRNSGKFAVLVIKTQTALPYSSVFIELDTGYWDRESEDALRARIRKKEEKAKKPPLKLEI